MYPLISTYEKPIQNFIDRLIENENLTIKTNTMSTQIHGNYDEIMATLCQDIHCQKCRLFKVTRLLSARTTKKYL